MTEVWKASIDLPPYEKIDLRGDQPTTGGTGGDVKNTSTSGFQQIYLFALRRGGITSIASPTFDQCVNAVNTKPTQQQFRDLPRPGQVLCVISAESPLRVAALRLESYNRSTRELAFDVTVWEEAP